MGATWAGHGRDMGGAPGRREAVTILTHLTSARKGSGNNGELLGVYSHHNYPDNGETFVPRTISGRPVTRQPV